jgi:hypothetical protein
VPGALDLHGSVVDEQIDRLWGLARDDENRLLSKLSTCGFKITNACDKIKPESETFSAITISIGYDFEAFNGANDVLTENTI